MKYLNGIKLNKDSLQVVEELGTLLFQEFSSTKLFINNFGELIIREWVDCSEDGLTDRYFFFRTDKFYLSKFLKLEITHLQLITYSLDGFLYFQDISKDHLSELTVISNQKVDNDYLPSYSFELNNSDFVDYNEINERLDLTSIDTFIDISSQVRNYSKSYKTEVYNLHIEKGIGVGHGKVDTKVLGKTLLKFDDLYENISLDISLGKSRGKVTEKLMAGTQYQPLTLSEVIGTIAASFSVLIKPRFTEYILFEDLSSSEMIAERTFKLINNSIDTELLIEDYNNYSEYTISAYKKFLKEIYSSGLNIGLSYFSDKKELEYSQRFTLNLSNKIINDIENLKFTEVENFRRIGKFRALNCDTGHFSFNSLDGENFKGYLDKLVKESSTTISFEKIYDISVSRSIIKDAGQEEPEIHDTIIAYYINKE